MNLTADWRLSDQRSIGPKAVSVQSKAAMRSAISPAHPLQQWDSAGLFSGPLLVMCSSVGLLSFRLSRVRGGRDATVKHRWRYRKCLPQRGAGQRRPAFRHQNSLSKVGFTRVASRVESKFA